MVEKFAKWIDLLAAVFLMFLFPALSIHVKMRDRLFETYVQSIREYGEMVQKQGYLSVEAAEKLLFGEGEAFGAARLAIWEEKEGERKLLTISRLMEESYDYMGAKVYPFSDGDRLLFVLRMQADGLEQAYYCFCGKAPVREYTCFFAVRDGLFERQEGWGEGEDEAISLYDAVYDSVSGNCVHAVRAGADNIAQGKGTAEDGEKCGFGGRCGGRIFGDVQ